MFMGRIITASGPLLLCVSLACVGLLGGACEGEDGTGDPGGDPATVCEVGEDSYAEGESFPAGDGCNTCVCDAGGEIDCTTMDCAEPKCSEEDCGPAPGMPNYLCDDGVTMAGPAGCEPQEDGSCGWTIVECPIDPCADVDCEDSQVCVEGACVFDPCAVVDCADSYVCVEGACVFDPCAELPCGEGCDPCDPAETDCSDGDVAAACNAEGICEAGFDAATCEPAACEPGEIFLGDDGCNMCVCPESGLKSEAACDDAVCDDDCEPGKNFLGDDGCNMCVCPESGLKSEAACDTAVCGDDCEPGEIFLADDGCNDCTCPESGMKAEAACTKKACGCDSNDDCADTAFCRFPAGDCGVTGNGGVCTERPEACVGGGEASGVCGCDGSWALNACELNANGADQFIFGGCQSPDPVALFACGDTACDIDNEYCEIGMNDVMGDDQPLYFSACYALPEGCAPGDCSCIPDSAFYDCYDGTGYAVMIYPGG